MLKVKDSSLSDSLTDQVSAAIGVLNQLLHNAPPDCAELECNGVSVPSHHLGGDYLDFLYEPERGRYWIFIGDIMGKGIPASMKMVMLRTAVRIIAPISASPSDLLQKVNNALWSDMTRLNSFATLFCGMFCIKSNLFTFASAGHPHPIFGKRNGEVEKLPQKGVAIGFLPDRTYKQHEITLNIGDSVVVCTDGILEAMDKNRKPYGYKRLMHKIQACLESGLENTKIIEAITDDVAFYRHGEQQDDVTLIVIRRNT